MSTPIGELIDVLFDPLDLDNPNEAIPEKELIASAVENGTLLHALYRVITDK